MKILFMGTPDFGAMILKALANSSNQVIGVVTQPDRPAGRKNILTSPPVKKTAIELGIPVLQVERLRGPEPLEKLREFSQGAEAFVVAAFGMLLPGAVLEMPPLKCINVHGSLLPQYRGASPVAQVILDGAPETGVTIMLMEKGLDTGPILSKTAVPISPEETQGSLMEKLAKVGAELLLETLPLWETRELKPQTQEEALATLTRTIKKEDGRIDWNLPAAQIERMVRAYNPWPGVYTFWNNQPLKIMRASALKTDEIKLLPGKPSLAPGETSLAPLGDNSGEPDQLIIGTGDGLLAPREIQMAGKKIMNSRDFLQGNRSFIGARLLNK